MAEGAPLLREYGVLSLIKGSNPFVSANASMNTPLSGRFCFLLTNLPAINFELVICSGLFVINMTLTLYGPGRIHTKAATSYGCVSFLHLRPLKREVYHQGAGDKLNSPPIHMGFCSNEGTRWKDSFRTESTSVG